MNEVNKKNAGFYVEHVLADIEKGTHGLRLLKREFEIDEVDVEDDATFVEISMDYRVYLEAYDVDAQGEIYDLRKNPQGTVQQNGLMCAWRAFFNDEALLGTTEVTMALTFWRGR